LTTLAVTKRGVERVHRPRAAADSLAQPPDTDEVTAIVKNLGVAASDIHLGETPARLRSKRTPLADYSVVYFVIHGLVGDVKGLGARPSNSRPSLTKACSPRAKSRNCSSTPISACNARARRALDFLIVRRSNFRSRPGSAGWSRNHGGKPTKSAAASD
jgi:hypothetical protein